MPLTVRDKACEGRNKELVVCIGAVASRGARLGGSGKTEIARKYEKNSWEGMAAVRGYILHAVSYVYIYIYISEFGFIIRGKMLSSSSS